MRLFPSAAVLLLAGCKGCQKDASLPEIVVPVDSAAVGVRVSDMVGPVPLAVPVFGVNLFGAVVAADGISVTSTAPLDSATPQADGVGWGQVTLTDAAPGTYGINASFSGTPGDATAWVTGGAPPTFGSPAANTPGATAVAVAGGGLAWSIAGTLWWAAPAGGSPVQVLALTDSIATLQAVQLDNDGVWDLLVVSGKSACVLRGRSSGGLTWAAGWAAASGSFVGGDVADLDGDGVNDVALATVSGQVTDVVWLIGDGTNTYTYTDHMQVAYASWGLSIEDLDSNGDGEVTLLSSDGLVRRYAHFDGEWSVAGGGEFDLNLGPGSRLYPSVDLDGDGIEDIVVSGPDMDAVGTQAYIVSTPERTIFQMFPGSDTDPLPTSLRGAVADLDGDAVPDLVLATDRELKRTAWNPERDNFDLFTYSDVPGGQPLAVGDVDGDQFPDVLLAGDAVTTYLGAAAGDDWSVRPVGGEALEMDLAGAPWLGDIDGDGIIDLVGYTSGGAGLKLAGWFGEAATEAHIEGFASRGDVVVGVDALPVALTVCGTSAYALVDDAGVTKLWKVEVDPSLGVGGAEWGIDVAGDALGCGGALEGVGDVAVLVGGADGSFAVTLDGGGVPSVVSVGSEPVGAIAIADTDGNGVGGLETCPVSGCGLVVADLNGDGTDDVATTGGGAVNVRTGSGQWTLPGQGLLTAADADGDGTLDLIASEGGLVQLFRVLAGGVTPPMARFLATSAIGPVYEGDLDGDGRVDLFWAGGHDGVADGTLLYLRATD